MYFFSENISITIITMMPTLLTRYVCTTGSSSTGVKGRQRLLKNFKLSNFDTIWVITLEEIYVGSAPLPLAQVCSGTSKRRNRRHL
jgi:hypothetical protein